MAGFLFYVGVTFGALLPIVNPVSTAPVFLALTAHASSADRRGQARSSALYASGILLTALLAGAFVLEFFGITLPILRIAGGLIVTRVGFGMLAPETPGSDAEDGRSGGPSAGNPAFVPIAMPMLSGPGAIAVTIAMATTATGWIAWVGIGVGIVLVTLVSWIVLRSSGAVLAWIGHTGMDALVRIMGLLIVCVGIEFVATGLVEGLTGDAMTRILRDWLRSIQAD